MGDKTPVKGSGQPKSWTEAEKLGLLFQIVVRSGPVPWDDLQLPEGRTVKACQVMIDREKQKVKKALAEQGKELATPNSRRKKRKVIQDTGEGDGDGDDEATEGAAMKPIAKRGCKKKDIEPAMKTEIEEDETNE
ncbi:hypothetical protein K431DRAFT_46055 [Polychaeton citri CBS 116435]|uniref:Myb-like domain-containing protein n=1 Tax=Polychaeton citri CBS 116435 TaxID=1314669 RepID=A0A9P4QCH1_9PEZI|nr:hypothetical protein K431DRAFT_46055 [Polychaeton citri CBS 116435]